MNSPNAKNITKRSSENLELSAIEYTEEQLEG